MTLVQTLVLLTALIKCCRMTQVASYGGVRHLCHNGNMSTFTLYDRHQSVKNSIIP